MPRPRKHRNVCSFPKVTEFFPADQELNIQSTDAVALTVDEYEAVRLIDYERFSQEDCSTRMGVARATVQSIYASARKKIALALVEGIPLKIDGGDYRLCNGRKNFFECGNCRKHRNAWNNQDKEINMIVAIPVEKDNESVCASFGRAPRFLFCNLETGETHIEDNPAENAEGGAGVKATQFIIDHGADTLIAVRIGGNADAALKAAHVKVYEASGAPAKNDIAALQAGELPVFSPFHFRSGGRR